MSKPQKQQRSLFETIRLEITREYNANIASKIMTAIEEDAFDDDSTSISL